MKFIIRIVVNAIALWITALILPAINITGGVVNYLIVALIFGVVNALIRPIVKLFSLPITVITLGLFSLVINALMLLLTSWLAGGMMTIDGGFLAQFGWAFVGSILISIASTVIGWLLPDN